MKIFICFFIVRFVVSLHGQTSSPVNIPSDSLEIDADDSLTFQIIDEINFGYNKGMFYDEMTEGFGSGFGIYKVGYKNQLTEVYFGFEYNYTVAFLDYIDFDQGYMNELEFKIHSITMPFQIRVNSPNRFVFFDLGALFDQAIYGTFEAESRVTNEPSNIGIYYKEVVYFQSINYGGSISVGIRAYPRKNISPSLSLGMRIIKKDFQNYSKSINNFYFFGKIGFRV